MCATVQSTAATRPQPPSSSDPSGTAPWKGGDNPRCSVASVLRLRRCTAMESLCCSGCAVWCGAACCMHGHTSFQPAPETRVSHDGWSPAAGFTTNPVILQRDGVPCTLDALKGLTHAARDLDAHELQLQAWGDGVKELHACALALHALDPDLITVSERYSAEKVCAHTFVSPSPPHTHFLHTALNRRSNCPAHPKGWLLPLHSQLSAQVPR
jgi:hypothetical protein